MLPDDIYEFTRATPFKPFRITLTSGEAFDVFHPDMTIATFTKVMIARNSGEPSEDRKIVVTHVNSQQILKIQELMPSTAAPAGKSTV